MVVKIHAAHFSQSVAGKMEKVKFKGKPQLVGVWQWHGVVGMVGATLHVALVCSDNSMFEMALSLLL